MDTGILCANCHRCVSDPSADQLVNKSDLPEARFLLGMAELLTERARFLREEEERHAGAAQP